jgi:hypothetical protein
MAKNCSACGRELTLRDSFVFQGKDVCKECLKKLESGEDVEKQHTHQIPEKFTPLYIYGGLLSLLGVISLVTSVVVILLGAISGQTLTLQFGSICLVSGFASLVIGQAVKCFMSIEKHIRGIYELLRDQTIK